MKVSKERQTQLRLAGRVIQDRGTVTEVSTKPEPAPDRSQEALNKIAQALEVLSKPAPAPTTMILPPLSVSEPVKRQFKFTFERDTNGFIKQIIATEE